MGIGSAHMYIWRQSERHFPDGQIWRETEGGRPEVLVGKNVELAGCSVPSRDITAIFGGEPTHR